MPEVPTRTLRFDPSLSEKQVAKVRDNLSAIVLSESHLWLGGDEGTSVHRMTLEPSGEFASHTTFELKDILSLPGADGEEIDIEGLDVNEGYLWLIGSHSSKRKKAEDTKTADENMQRLGRLELQGNRFTLGRVPLDPSATPVRSHGALAAARLDGDASGNALTAALSADAHVAPFVARPRPDGSLEGIPSKDNGLDVEGLAVSGRRVFCGLRGPVLRGWAIILELELTGGDGQAPLSLKPLGQSGEPYLKHFLNLRGLGIRDLVIDGTDLLVLAGPSMDLDGPVNIYRWKGALDVRAHSLTWTKDLSLLVTVPFGVGKDHAEGLSLASRTPMTLMVCYDSPGAPHLDKDDPHVVKADLFTVTR